MDLLFALQNLRESAPSWINTFFVFFSEGNLLAAPLVASCLFWAADKKKGRYVMAVFAFAYLVNGLLKLSFCIYRPWILDPRLYCAPEAVEESTGYSFPSAHCTMMTSIFGAAAYAFREKKWLTPFTAVLTAVMMFARMYLGCHTLLDVTVGAALGLIFVFAFRSMLTLPYEDVGTDRITLSVIAVLLVASGLYALFKSYPADLAADGTLLADPHPMMQDTFGAMAIVAGLVIGNLLEIRYIHFEKADTVKKIVLRCVIGSIVFALLYTVIVKKLVASLDPNLGKFLRYLACILWTIAAFPAVIRKSNGRL